MGTLPTAGLEQLEGHLLICLECRQRLEGAEGFVRAMRAAAATIRGIGTDE